jgi:hypothetical protein
MKTVLAVMLLVVLSAGFATFVYPTRYRIQQGTVDGAVVTMRVDRLTGDVMYATEDGWSATLAPKTGLSAKTRAILEGRN